MSRLTFRDSKGELWIKDAAHVDEQGQICMLTDRLAAYEDTGLEPEEIKDHEEMFAAYRHVCGGKSPEEIVHALELTEAERNGRLVVYIAKRFENTGVNIEDLISVGTIGLIKAVNTFNASKNIKLATYASRCIENEILMYLRKISSQRTEIGFELDKHYCDIANERIRKALSEKAVGV